MCKQREKECNNMLHEQQKCTDPNISVIIIIIFFSNISVIINKRTVSKGSILDPDVMETRFQMFQVFSFDLEQYCLFFDHVPFLSYINH